MADQHTITNADAEAVDRAAALAYAAAIERQERRQERETIRTFLRAAAEGNLGKFWDAFTALEFGGGWRRAFQALGRSGSVHDEIRPAFLDAWVEYGRKIRNEVGKDLTLIAGLRLLLPPYAGPPLTLYRGDGWANRKRRTYGLSWTDDHEVARCFASGIWREASEGGGVLLQVEAPADAIICAPALIENDHSAEREFIVDRRRLKNVRVIEHFPQELP